MQFVFDELKTVQTAARLLDMHGGRMSYIKLIKLMYLVDRFSLTQTGYPVTGDRMVSMDHGPVLSTVLDLVTWGRHSERSLWSETIARYGAWEVELNAPPGRDELSDYETELIDDVHRRFGGMTDWALVDYTHELPEWEEPHGTSISIDVRVILQEAGMTDDEIREIAAQAEAVRALQHFASSPV